MSHFSVAGEQIVLFTANQPVKMKMALQSVWAGERRESETEKMVSGKACKRCASRPASLTSPLSYSCSCCHLWTLGWPAESSSSSFPQPGPSLYFFGQCSGAFYLLLLKRQKTKGMIALLSPSGDKKCQPTLWGPQMKRMHICKALLLRKREKKVFQTMSCWVGWKFSSRSTKNHCFVSI